MGLTRLHCLQVNLSRWDLFHAHAFRSWRDGKLGLLFHAKEYPQECEAFPYNLGFCQRGSSLKYDTPGMDFRNLLFYEVRWGSCLPCMENKLLVIIKPSLYSMTCRSANMAD